MSNIGIRTTGPVSFPIEFTVLGPVTEEDVAVLNTTPKGSAPAPIKRLRERHHALARCLADGMGLAEASAVAGYNPQRAGLLKQDPAFQELVAFYRQDLQKVYTDTHTRLANLGAEALEILQERMEEDPEKIPTKILLAVATAAADRTGHGTTSTQVNVNVNLADRLSAARKRVEDAKRASGLIIEGEILK